MENTQWCIGERCFLLSYQNRSYLLLFHAPWEGNDLYFLLHPSLSLSTSLCFLDQYCPVYITSLIPPPGLHNSQPLMSMCMGPHVSPGSSNIIQAYSFPLEWRTNLSAPKNRGSCFSFLSTTHYTLWCLKHYWPLLQSLIALVWPTLLKSGSQRLINCWAQCKPMMGVTTCDVTKLWKRITDSNTELNKIIVEWKAEMYTDMKWNIDL